MNDKEKDRVEFDGLIQRLRTEGKEMSGSDVLMDIISPEKHPYATRSIIQEIVGIIDDNPEFAEMIPKDLRHFFSNYNIFLKSEDKMNRAKTLISICEEGKTVKQYLEDIRKAIMDYSPKQSNPNFSDIALQAMEGFEKQLLPVMDKSDPESLKTLLKSIPDFFTTPYHDASIPEYCLKYSIRNINKVAQEIAKAAGVTGGGTPS